MCSKSKHKIIITYNGEIVAGSLLIRESRKIARLLLKNADSEAWHQAIVVENILQKRSPVAAKRQARLIKNRLSLMNPELWEIVDKGPIYWLFSSGRQKAFECLVYLHRYNESTLSRMRSTYVTPLQGNFSARLELLQNEKEAAPTASAQKKFQKEMDTLKKKQAELSKFDDGLRHHADMKISLDLDDGVKVNYGKFGDLLVEEKAITGKK